MDCPGKEFERKTYRYAFRVADVDSGAMAD